MLPKNGGGEGSGGGGCRPRYFLEYPKKESLRFGKSQHVCFGPRPPLGLPDDARDRRPRTQKHRECFAVAPPEEPA